MDESVLFLLVLFSIPVAISILILLGAITRNTFLKAMIAVFLLTGALYFLMIAYMPALQRAIREMMDFI